MHQPVLPTAPDAAALSEGCPAEMIDRAAKRHRTMILLMLTFIYSLNYLDRQIVVILQEPIKADFGLADWELGLLTGGAFGIFYTAMGVPIAHVIDRGVNRVRLIAAFTAAWSVMTAVCGLARGFGQFFVARMGVGLAEAGFTPAAHSLISDLYPPRERSAAVGLFAIGVPVGMMVGMIVGGIVAQVTDWRTALLVAGAPGVLVAILFPLIAKEPMRGASDLPAERAKDVPERLSFLEGLRILARRPAFVHIVAGSAAIAFAQMGIMTWLPSFLIRSHGLNLAETGIGLGLVSGICGALGTWLGGWQGTRFGRSGLHAVVWLPIVGLILSVPIYLMVVTVGSGSVALLLLIPSSIVGALWTAPSIALTQSLAPVAMRARASAVYIVAANLIGVSMGPLVAGVLSDWFAGLHGGDAALGLRDAMMTLTLFLFWGAGHWVYASRLLKREGEASEVAA
jgi:MFS transporter, Spinster family, sphingosine-1-phosphate transporter